MSAALEIVRMAESERRSRVWFALILTGLALLALAGPTARSDAKEAKGKKEAGSKSDENPLAGRWVGMTEMTVTYQGAPAPLSYRITKSGKVLDFETTVTSSRELGGAPCPTPVVATFTVPPLKLQEPAGIFSKGKRFELIDGVGGSPPATVEVTGKVAPPFKKARNMEGGIGMGRLTGPMFTPSGPCRTGNVGWSAERVGGK